MQREYKVTIMYADGFTQTSEEFFANGRVIKAENNVAVNDEVRRAFYPEAIAEERNRRRRELAAARRKEILSELEKINKSLRK